MFQANRREVDLALVRENYAHADVPAQNDFLGLVGSKAGVLLNLSQNF